MTYFLFYRTDLLNILMNDNRIFHSDGMEAESIECIFKEKQYISEVISQFTSKQDFILPFK